MEFLQCEVLWHHLLGTSSSIPATLPMYADKCPPSSALVGSLESLEWQQSQHFHGQLCLLRWIYFDLKFTPCILTFCFLFGCVFINWPVSSFGDLFCKTSRGVTPERQEQRRGALLSTMDQVAGGQQLKGGAWLVLGRDVGLFTQGLVD